MPPPPPAHAEADALRDRGNALYLAGRFAEAAYCYRAALRLRTDDADAWCNLGAALADQGQLADSLGAYEAALRLRPDHADALYNAGNALRLLGRHDEAVAAYARALRLRPDAAVAHNNLGIALRSLGRLAEAERSLHEALRLRPDDPLALTNLGLALADGGRLAESIACYDSALALDPNAADAHRNRSLALLLTGDLARGLPEYAWRWRCADFRPPLFPQPAWRGEPLDGRTVLFYTEQGLGDTLQFCRFCRPVQDRGGRVVLAVQPALLPLLDGLDGVDQLVSATGPMPGFDLHLPLLSVPGVLGTTVETIPATVPYLRPEPARAEHWRRELEPVAGLRVGIAWQGSREVLYDRSRSFPLARFAPLAAVEGVRLVSLQKGPGAEQVAGLGGSFEVIDLGPRLDGQGGAFLDTAAAMASLDLVIACDSALAHLAGALGVRCWLALPAVPDWRWFLDREDTPWYPTLRLFRQRQPGDWAEPFDRMAAELRRLVVGLHARSVPIGVSPGELIDRISILAIKAERIVDPDRLRNVRAELAEQRAALAAAVEPSPWLDVLAGELRAVNLAIWETEDALRDFERAGEFGPAFVDRARSVYHNNDLRATLKRRINDRLGWGRNEEKSYAPYTRPEEEAR